jgi:hypothetical protein
VYGHGRMGEEEGEGGLARVAPSALRATVAQ